MRKGNGNNKNVSTEERERRSFGVEYEGYISESIGDETVEKDSACRLAFRCGAALNPEGKSPKKRVQICPNATERECCAYCPNVKYRARANKICAEIFACTDLLFSTFAENIRLKKQLELERWRLGQLKKMFESDGKKELFKVVLSYAGDYCVEAENARAEKMRKLDRKIKKQKDEVCGALKEAMPERPASSGEEIPYTFIDADGKEQTVMVEAEIAEGLIALDDEMRKANEREAKHIADFKKDPFTSDMQPWTERKIGSIYGYAQIGDVSRKSILEMREMYAERFNQYWNNIDRKETWSIKLGRAK